MQRTTVAILLIACLALLGAQLAGLHAHADSHGFDAAIQSTHDHHHNDGDHHDDEVDVQVVDFGIGTSKVLFLALALCLTLFLLPPAQSGRLVDREAPLPLRQRLRWRPPLRGPPLLAHTA